MLQNLPNKIFLFPVVAAAAILTALFIFARFGPAIPISVVTSNKTEFFAVTGEGRATAVPNEAQINLRVSASGPTVAQAQAQANDTINSVSREIKMLKIEEKDIQTTSYNLRPDFDFADPNRRGITGYTAEINLLVKARQLDKINQIIDTATSKGANQVGGLTFTLDDATRETLEGKARQEAISKAKKKANALARESGMTLGRIVNVSETPVTTPPIYASQKALLVGAGGETTRIEPGTSEITVFVTLSYETR